VRAGGTGVMVLDSIVVRFLLFLRVVHRGTLFVTGLDSVRVPSEESSGDSAVCRFRSLCDQFHGGHKNPALPR
jgi:hypothetical protein